MEESVLNAMKKAGEIATDLEVDGKTVSKAIKRLKKKEQILSPKRCYYSRP